MKKNTDKTYTATKEINGVTYTAQFNGVRAAIDATNKYGKDELKLAEYLLTHVIVEPPGLQVDDFDDLPEYREVTNFALNVMSGRFRRETESRTDQSGSGKELAAVAAGTE